MKRFFSTVVACAMFSVAQVQGSTHAKLPKLYEIENSSEWTSELLTFEEPIEGIRITYFETYTSKNYKGFPFIDLAELDILDANGNEIDYTATTNSLADDGGGLDALNDNNTNTHYHAAYSGNVVISLSGYVYLELTFDTPQTAFSYRQVRRRSNPNYPTSFVISDVGEDIVDKSGNKGLKYSIKTKAQIATSGVLQEIGLDSVNYVTELKVTGSINSYDMIVFRDKMINLHTLDLSTATVEASATPYIGSCSTSANDLGPSAFEGFARFGVIKLPKNLEKISTNAFSGCVGLVSIEIPQTVKSIGADAFYNCRQLTDVVIPDYVQKIESRAFQYCQALDTLRLPNALQDIESSAFYNCTGLKSVVLPQTMNTIGSQAFSECSSIDTITMPKSLTRIGAGAFSYCRSLKTINIPQGLKSLPDGGSSSGVFCGCSSLVTVTIPEGLQEIGEYAFSGCSKLNNIMLPPTVTVIGRGAFNNNSSLTEIRIPASVTSIGESAFSGCGKLDDVYTYTVEPTSIAENTFGADTYTNATLYVPAVSFFNYYWDKGWKRFLNLASFDEPYEYFYVNNDYVLDKNTGYIEGEDGKVPDADINAGGALVVEGEQTDDDEPHQNLGNVNVGHNGGNNCGSIIGDNNLHVDKLNIRINVTGNKWYFFSFPFDVKRSDIKMQNGSDFVFRYYDGEERAQHGHGGWKDMKDEDFHAGRGFIFQSSATDVLMITVSDVRFKKDNKQNDLNAYVSDNLKDASWNFVGNPYLSYYDMEDMDYTAPITRWDGSKYVAMRPGDDLYHFAPCEAFFVQKPEGKEHIGYDGKKQMTANQSNAKKQEVGQAQKLNTTFGVERERFLINLVLGNDAETDQTRVVFNELQSMDYETACDAAKFETKGVTQIYTLDSRKVRYAINERPKADGVVPVGFSVNESGSYTIEAKRMDIHVILVDNETGVVHNLSEGAYTFSTDAGTYETRFTLMLEGADVTGVESVKLSDVLNAGTPVYDLGGRLVRPVKGGVYIIDGVKVRMK